MTSGTRPARWAVSNWPVRTKVAAIVVIPLLLAVLFGGARVYSGATDAASLRTAAGRAAVVPAVADYMAALQEAMVTATDGGDARAAVASFGERKTELANLLGSVEVGDTVRSALDTLVDSGQDLLDRISANSIDLRTRVTTFGPLLLTAETAITGLVSGGDDAVRSEADVLARAVGSRGQMAMQQMLVTRGAELPEPELRSSLVTLAGTEPASVTAMGDFLGGSSAAADALRSQMVGRMTLLSDPATVVAGNPELLASQKITADIAESVVSRTADEIPAAVSRRADDARAAAIRDGVLAGAAVLLALLVVSLVARSLVRPLRTLRDSALKVAHEDLPREVEVVRVDGKELTVQPVPVHTSEEIGQVAHAVDELHQQAVVLAGEQARLQMQVTDMFETLSRRNQSLVDQQLSLIDRLESDEEDPDRLQSLFRLDHLAARMRRNGANLMVLAGAPIARERTAPVSVTALVNAAASEVEDYTRIVTADLPDSEVDGAVAPDLIHLLAELLDNGLRYSPPTSRVQVSAVHTGTNGLVVEVADTGLGMTEPDLRVANARLQSGGQVNPYTARHMGLFVVSRLAAAHGLVVRLRSTVAKQAGSGTTAGVYIPARHLVQSAAGVMPAVQIPEVPRAPVADAMAGSSVSVTIAPAAPVLPRRDPGASGFPVPPAPARKPEPVPVSVSEDPVVAEVPRAGHAAVDDDDAIYQKMLSEWLVDPHELSHSTDLNWKSVWDNGWSAAQAAQAAPVRSHTSEGLPIRQPGARLIPGQPDEQPAADSGDTGRPFPVRNPDAVRASLGGHFGGVQAGRRRAQEELDSP